MTHVLIFKDTIEEGSIPRVFLGSCHGSKELDLDPELSARISLMLAEVLDQPKKLPPGELDPRD